MIKIASGDNIRSFMGTSDDTKPTNVDAFKSQGTSDLGNGVTETYEGPYIGQGSTFFELDTQKIFIYDESPSAKAQNKQWVELDDSIVHVKING